MERLTPTSGSWPSFYRLRLGEIMQPVVRQTTKNRVFIILQFTFVGEKCDLWASTMLSIRVNEFCGFYPKLHIHWWSSDFWLTLHWSSKGMDLSVIRYNMLHTGYKCFLKEVQKKLIITFKNGNKVCSCLVPLGFCKLNYSLLFLLSSFQVVHVALCLSGNTCKSAAITLVDSSECLSAKNTLSRVISQ